VPIKCEYQNDISNKKEERVYIVNENDNALYNVYNRKVNGEHTITDKTISVSYKKDSTIMKYTIDRYTGKFEGEIIIQQTPSTVKAKLTGSCEKTNLKRKF